MAEIAIKTYFAKKYARFFCYVINNEYICARFLTRNKQ